jgi:hypothetical protein
LRIARGRGGEMKQCPSCKGIFDEDELIDVSGDTVIGCATEKGERFISCIECVHDEDDVACELQRKKDKLKYIFLDPRQKNKGEK